MLPKGRPLSQVECVAVEGSDFSLELLTAWLPAGLFFLLDAEIRRRFSKKIAEVLQSGSNFFWLPVSRKGAQILPRVEPDL